MDRQKKCKLEGNILEISKSQVPGTNRINIHTVTGASFTGYSKGKGDKFVPGKSFIWPGQGLGYYHILVDILTDWLICKENHPDLKLYSVASTRAAFSALEQSNPQHAELIKEMLPLEEIIYIEDYDNIFFENIIFCSAEMNRTLHIDLGLDRELGTTGGEQNPRFKEWHTLMYEKVNLFFNKYKAKQNSSLKVFVSRQKENKLLESFINEDDDVNYVKFGVRERELRERSMFRYIEPHNEKIVEKFFADNGFLIVDFSEMSFAEQAHISSLATTMVGFQGAGMLNGIFMPKGSKMILLNTCNVDSFYHPALHRLFLDDVFSIPPTAKLSNGLDLTIHSAVDNSEGANLFKKFDPAEIIDYIISHDNLSKLL